jgi:D-xylose transport system permease protein
MTKTFSLRDLTMPLVLAGIWLFFAIASPQFLSPRNLSMLMIELAVTATLAFGMLLVILPGHIDLSAGAGLGMIGGIASVLVFRHEWPAPRALLLAAAVALAVWAGIGALIVRYRIQAFIITLGGLLVFRGIFWLIIRSSTVPVARGGESNLYSLLTTYYVPPVAGLILVGAAIAILAAMQYRRRAQRMTSSLVVESGELAFLKLFAAGQAILLAVLICNQYRGVPLSFLILSAIALGVHVLTRHTPFGRYLYAIGGNEEAAVISGIPVRRVVNIAFVLMGGIVAITGFLQTAYAGASTTSVGELMELDAVAACVIGGTSLRGGRGTVLGALFGSLIMASLLNGMTLLAVSPELKLIVRGTVLVLAVLMDRQFDKR